MMSWRDGQRAEYLALVGFAGVLLLFIFSYATAPIADPDFWWHLKSGEVTVQTGGLLQSDPFTFSGDGVVSNIEKVILKGYWLWQVTAYGLYSLFGFNGIFLLNFVTICAMVGVVAQQMRRQGVGIALSVLLITIGFSLLRHDFPLARPQVISFLFAAILLAQLARVRDGGRFGWTLPLLMMFWANIHGGFVAGDIMLLCFLAGAVIEYRQDLPRLRHVILWVGIGIGASLLNPNGGLAFGELLKFSVSKAPNTIVEFQSTWIMLQNGSWIFVIPWLLIALYGVGLWSSRRIFWPELMVALFLAYSSVSYIRNAPFFSVAMLPAIGFSLQQGMVLRSKSITPRWGVLIVVIAASCLLWQTNISGGKVAQEAEVSSFFPEKTSQFILDSGLTGKMLNSYNFGGYQIWKFYPQHLVFIDGRNLNADVYSDWRMMVSASLKDVDGRKEFEVLLDRYDIDYVVQPHIFYDTGRLTPLLKFLMVKPEWIPIYVDQQCFILVRNSQQNAAVIERYRIDKVDFNNRVIGHLKAFSKQWPNHVVNHVALAEMLIFVGRYDQAEFSLSIIKSLQPDNPHLPSLHNQLEVLKNAKRP